MGVGGGLGDFGQGVHKGSILNMAVRPSTVRRRDLYHLPAHRQFHKTARCCHGSLKGVRCPDLDAVKCIEIHWHPVGSQCPQTFKDR